jgi:hypothetical protein
VEDLEPQVSETAEQRATRLLVRLGWRDKAEQSWIVKLGLWYGTAGRISSSETIPWMLKRPLVGYLKAWRFLGLGNMKRVNSSDAIWVPRPMALPVKLVASTLELSISTRA